MKFTITRDNLVTGLKAIAGVIPTRTTLPILSNVCIEATAEGVELSGTDLDVAVTVRVPAEVTEEGATTAPYRKLHELAKNLPEAPVRVERMPKEVVRVTAGSARYDFIGMPVEETAEFPKVSYDGAWRLEAGDLHRLIAAVAFCASTEESRPILNGVLWQLRPDGMRMVATNGHRLARGEVDATPFGSPNVDLIVPPKALNVVGALFGFDEEIEVGHSGNHVGFKGEQGELLCRLIEGPYPNYEQVIPKDGEVKHRAAIDRVSLQRALSRANVVASGPHHRCVLTFADGGIQVDASRPDLGEGHEQMAVEISEPITICFNGKYLAECVDHVPGDGLVVRMVQPERAALIEPSEPNGLRLTYLLMPLRLLDV